VHTDGISKAQVAWALTDDIVQKNIASAMLGSFLSHLRVSVRKAVVITEKEVNDVRRISLPLTFAERAKDKLVIVGNNPVVDIQLYTRAQELGKAVGMQPNGMRSRCAPLPTEHRKSRSQEP